MGGKLVQNIIKAISCSLSMGLLIVFCARPKGLRLCLIDKLAWRIDFYVELNAESIFLVAIPSSKSTKEIKIIKFNVIP